MAATRSSVCTSRAEQAPAPARLTQGVAAGGASVAAAVGNEASRRVMSAGLWVSGLPYLLVWCRLWLRAPTRVRGRKRWRES